MRFADVNAATLASHTLFNLVLFMGKNVVKIIRTPRKLFVLSANHVLTDVTHRPTLCAANVMKKTHTLNSQFTHDPTVSLNNPLFSISYD